MRIGKAFRERDILVALRVFAHFIKGDKLTGLGLGLVNGEFRWINPEGGGQFDLGWLALQLLRKNRRNTCNTSMMFMHRAWGPIPATQLIEDRTPYANGTKTAKRGASRSVVAGGRPKITEHSGTLQIVMIEVTG